MIPFFFSFDDVTWKPEHIEAFSFPDPIVSRENEELFIPILYLESSYTSDAELGIVPSSLLQFFISSGTVIEFEIRGFSSHSGPRCFS